MCVIKRKLKFEDCKNCSEATQIENKISHIEKNKISADSLEDQKEFLKTQQRFKSEKHNGLAVEINKTALSSNYDKRMQSINSTETYAPRTNRDQVCKKQEIKCNNIIN